MKRTRRVLASSCLAIGLAAAPWAARQAWAITKISNVRVSNQADGADAGGFGGVPTGASSAWVLFDYAGANKTTISVVVFGKGGDILANLKNQKYSGAGTASVEVTAAALVHRAADQAEMFSEDMRAMAELGSSTSAVDSQILDAHNSLKRDLLGLSRVMVHMDLAGLTGDALAAKQAIVGLFPKAQDAVADLDAIDLSEVEAMRTRLKAFEPDAVELANAAGDLSTSVAKVSSYTMAAFGVDSTPYSVSVKVDEVGGVSSTGGSTDLLIVAGNKADGNNVSGGAPTPQATFTPWLPASVQNELSSSGRPNTPVSTAPTGGTAPSGANLAAATQSAPAAALTRVAGGGTAAPVALAGEPGDQPPVTSSDAGGGTAPPVVPEAAGSDAGAGPASRDLQSATGADASGSLPLPTFTVAAGGSASPDGATQPSAGRGPNLLVLGAGVVVLIGLALWFRRRL